MEENKGFLEGRTFLAIILSLIAFVFWSSWMKQKYPDSQKPTAPLQETSRTKEEPLNKPFLFTEDKTAKTAYVPEKTYMYSHKNWSFKVSSKGMSLQDIKLLNYKDRKDQDIELTYEGLEYLPYELRLKGDPNPLNFQIQKFSENVFVGTAKTKNMIITRRLVVDSEKYLIKNKVSVKGSLENFKGISIYNQDKFEEIEGGFFQKIFSPNMDLKKIFVLQNTDESWILPVAEEVTEESFQKLNSLAVSTQYFASVFVNTSDFSPKASVTAGGKRKEIFSEISFSPPRGVILKNYQFEYALFLGPKESWRLKELQPRLNELLDLGLFSSLGRLLLGAMQFFHSIFQNWGVAIIFLTFLIRLLVLPFNIISYRSMRKMSEVGPVIQNIRKKYKDDSQKMNQEVLKLYREKKINPMMGCLPMLLQMPVFFALYGVLRQSIELYKAPFFFWVEDLSAKDPYYVFPALLLITMLLQQKFSPGAATMEPLQKKMMYGMLFVFSFLMLPLASGLTLSFFISGLWACVQQAAFYKFEKKTKP